MAENLHIPPAAKRFLDTLNDQTVVELMELIVLHQRMPREAVEFLERAKPETLEWLTNARPEEVAQLDEGVRLVRSMRTVGKFGKWAIITLFGIFFGMVAVGEYVVKLLALLRGGRN